MFILIIVCAIDNKLRTIFTYMFALYVRFSSLLAFFNLLIIFFNLFNIIIISIRLSLVKDALCQRIIFLIRAHYLFNVVIESLNAYSSFDL